MLKTLAVRFANLYALWVILSWVVACAYPPAFTWFDGPWVSGALSMVMLGMGLTLTPDDFRRVVAMPRAVALGFIAQYTIMPATSWAVARVLNLDAPFAVGLILVGCCPGGTASNVVTYLAGAHVALSVTLTMVSTVMSVILTPILLQAWAGEIVEVDGWGMLRTTASIVLAPIAAGVYLSRRFSGIKAASAVYGPAVAVLAIVMIAGSIMARNLDAILGHGVRLAAAGFLLHVAGFALGYGAARAFRMSMIEARTVSIEVGMQNSGMAMVLANRHFSPVTAAPAVFSSIFHTLVGSLCAAYWRVRPPADAAGAAGTAPPPPRGRGRP